MAATYKGGWKRACDANYKTNCGCLIEMKIPGLPSICYARSTVLDQRIFLDTRAMFHEEAIKPATAEELYMKVQKIVPSTTEVVKPSNKFEGWWRVDHDTFDALPELDWYVIFSLYGIEIEEHLAKKQKKARNAVEWYGSPEQKEALHQNDLKKAEARQKAKESALTHYLGGGASASSSNP